MAVIYYTVEPGNTLWGIAQFFGTTVNDIARYNGVIEPYIIYPGQRLRIPVNEVSPPKWYVVRPGDSVWSIAQRYNIGLDDILNSNDINDPNAIYPGQLIRLFI